MNLCYLSKSDITLSDLEPKKVVLKESDDLLPPEPKETEPEETYFYEGRVITKTEYIKLNIKEDVKAEDLYTDNNEYTTLDLDKALKELEPEEVEIKKVKKKDSNIPDLNDLFN